MRYTSMLLDRCTTNRQTTATLTAARQESRDLLFPEFPSCYLNKEIRAMTVSFF